MCGQATDRWGVCIFAVVLGASVDVCIDGGGRRAGPVGADVELKHAPTNWSSSSRAHGQILSVGAGAGGPARWGDALPPLHRSEEGSMQWRQASSWTQCILCGGISEVDVCRILVTSWPRRIDVVAEEVDVVAEENRRRGRGGSKSWPRRRINSVLYSEVDVVVEEDRLVCAAPESRSCVVPVGVSNVRNCILEGSVGFVRRSSGFQLVFRLGAILNIHRYSGRHSSVVRAFDFGRRVAGSNPAVAPFTSGIDPKNNPQVVGVPLGAHRGFFVPIAWLENAKYAV